MFNAFRRFFAPRRPMFYQGPGGDRYSQSRGKKVMW